MPQSEYIMNIFYIIGVIVVILFVAGFLGLRWTKYSAPPGDHEFKSRILNPTASASVAPIELARTITPDGAGCSACLIDCGSLRLFVPLRSSALNGWPGLLF
jgi:hypothetical protein